MRKLGLTNGIHTRMLPPMGTPEHWDAIYGKRPATEVSWYRPHLERSLRFVEQARLRADAAILDVGGGASTLVDDLPDRGFTKPTGLDPSPRRGRDRPIAGSAWPASRRGDLDRRERHAGGTARTPVRLLARSGGLPFSRRGVLPRPLRPGRSKRAQARRAHRGGDIRPLGARALQRPAGGPLHPRGHSRAVRRAVPQGG